MIEETEVSRLRQGYGVAGRSETGGQRSQVRDQNSVATVNPQPATDYGAELSTINIGQSGSDQLSTKCDIALLSGGGDKPYALGLSEALTSEGLSIEFIGSDHLSVPELLDNPRIRFLNLREQRSDAGAVAKVLRVLTYYARLIVYAAKSQPRIFHILWNNKLELVDRTLLMLYYKSLGKRVVFTVHNVNMGKRDGNDSMLNRYSLRIQYRLCDHIFVHTEQMKQELCTEFAVEESKVDVVPFGINNTVPNTRLSIAEAKRRLGVTETDKTLLFFGNITPYKGLESLISAFVRLLSEESNYRLIIAGRVKKSEAYWKRIQEEITAGGVAGRIIQRIEYIPDEETELYFKAADVLVLPYTHIFQSGVLFLGYSFGLPAIASDVGSLREEIVEGKTGLLFRSQDSADLTRVVSNYFESELFRNLERSRTAIKEYANERYSWAKVAAVTVRAYSTLQQSNA